jgi:hypothetical protein
MRPCTVIVLEFLEAIEELCWHYRLSEGAKKLIIPCEDNINFGGDRETVTPPSGGVLNGVRVL